MRQEFKNDPVGPLRFFFEQILFLQPVELPVWSSGLVWFFAAPEGKRFRFLGWAYFVVMIVFMCSAWEILLRAADLSDLDGVRGRRARRILFRSAAAAMAGFGVLRIDCNRGGGHACRSASRCCQWILLSATRRYSRTLAAVKMERDPTVALPQLYADMFGWENMASAVARVYHGLPPREQSTCAILAGNYGEAGAIDYYGPALGLPKAISGHNNYFLWGPRNYSGECVIVFGENADRYARLFGDSQLVATNTDEHAMPSEQGVHVYVCRKPSAPLAILWPNFKMII